MTEAAEKNEDHQRKEKYKTGVLQEQVELGRAICRETAGERI